MSLRIEKTKGGVMLKRCYRQIRFHGPAARIIRTIPRCSHQKLFRCGLDFRRY